MLMQLWLLLKTCSTLQQIEKKSLVCWWNLIIKLSTSFAEKKDVFAKDFLEWSIVILAMKKMLDLWLKVSNDCMSFMIMCIHAWILIPMDISNVLVWVLTIKHYLWHLRLIPFSLVNWLSIMFVYIFLLENQCLQYQDLASFWIICPFPSSSSPLIPNGFVLSKKSRASLWGKVVPFRVSFVHIWILK